VNLRSFQNLLEGVHSGVDASFREYYGVEDYLNEIVGNAFQDKPAEFASGSMDLSSYGVRGRAGT